MFLERSMFEVELSDLILQDLKLLRKAKGIFPSTIIAISVPWKTWMFLSPSPLLTLFTHTHTHTTLPAIESSSYMAKSEIPGQI